MFTRREAGVFLKMLRAQRLGNHVLAAEPFAKVNQPAAARAKRAVFFSKPIAGLSTYWTSDPAKTFIGFLWQWL